MFSRALVTLAVLGATVTLAATAARAQTRETPFWGIYCGGYISTNYGAVGRCTQVSGSQARYGNYSRLTNEFLPITDWRKIVSEQWFRVWVRATDGYDGTFHGYTSVETPYGPVVWGIQVMDLGSLGYVGRWGNYNELTKIFYPDETGQSSWRLAV